MLTDWYYEFLLPRFIQNAMYSEVVRHDELATEIKELLCVIDGMPKWRFRRRHKLLWRLWHTQNELKKLMVKVAIYRFEPIHLHFIVGV